MKLKTKPKTILHQVYNEKLVKQKPTSKTLTAETVMLRQDQLETLTESNRQLKALLKQKEKMNLIAKKEYKEAQDHYVLVSKRVGASPLQGQDIDTQIMAMKLQVKELRQDIENKQTEMNRIKQKVKDENHNENQIAILEGQIENILISATQDRSGSQHKAQLMEIFQNQTLETYRLKRESIASQQSLHGVTQQGEQAMLRGRHMLASLQYRLAQLSTLNIQIKNKIKSYRHQPKQAKGEEQHRVQLQGLAQRMFQQHQQMHHQWQQDCLSRQQQITLLINAQALPSKSLLITQSIDNIEPPQQPTFQTDSDKKIKAYFRFIKERLIAQGISQEQCLENLKDKLGQEDLSILDVKSILEMPPFYLSNKFILDEVARQVLNSRILNNQQLTMHSATIVYQKLAALIGDYELLNGDQSQQYNHYIEQNINKIELDFDLDNVIDCQDILYLFEGNLYFLNLFVKYYLQAWPKDDCIYQLHLQRCLSTLRKQYYQYDIVGRHISSRGGLETYQYPEEKEKYRGRNWQKQEKDYNDKQREQQQRDTISKMEREQQQKEEIDKKNKKAERQRQLKQQIIQQQLQEEQEKQRQLKEKQKEQEEREAREREAKEAEHQRRIEEYQRQIQQEKEKQQELLKQQQNEQDLDAFNSQNDPQSGSPRASLSFEMGEEGELDLISDKSLVL